jgi:hypothetical protein
MRKRRYLATTLALSILAPGSPGVACSIPPPEPAYWYRTHPDFPLQEFVGGRLGIVRPTWDPSYLVVAYRAWNGLSIDRAQRDELLELWARKDGHVAVGKEAPPEGNSAVTQWYAARRETGFAARSVAGYRLLRSYASFANCLDDAFVTASATLRARAKRYGSDSTTVRQWVVAQDQVFDNCGGDPFHGYPQSRPAPLAEPIDALAAADREYQIASALFYSGRFEAAEAAFRQISTTADSPWRIIARHLVARCFIRKATLRSEGVDREALRAAHDELRDILSDSALHDVHPASRRLLEFVLYRLEPERHCEEVRARITHQAPVPTLAGDVADVGRCATSPPRDDLAMWLQALPSIRNAGAEERRRLVSSSLDRWRQQKGVHWLVAALLSANADEPRLDEVLEGGREFDAPASALPTVSYNLARLEIAQADRPSARRRLDGLLAMGEDALGRASYNLARSLRFQAADDLDDLLRHAALRPAGWVDPDFSDDAVATSKRDDAWRLDPKTAEVLSWLPLSLQVEALRGDALPVPVRIQLAGAAWVKAVALGRDEIASAIAERLIVLEPGAQSLLARYLHAADAAARSREALMILSRNTYPPVVRPLGSLVGNVAPAPAKELRWADGWYSRRSWSCGVGHLRCHCEPSSSCSGCEVWPWNDVEQGFPAFLTADDRAESRREWEELKAVGSGPEFLCTRAIAWAREHPGDARVPEVLHRAVTASRWACEGDRVGTVARRAFRILHAQYAGTSWARQTKYWYRGR